MLKMWALSGGEDEAKVEEHGDARLGDQPETRKEQQVGSVPRLIGRLCGKGHGLCLS